MPAQTFNDLEPLSSVRSKLNGSASAINALEENLEVAESALNTKASIDSLLGLTLLVNSSDTVEGYALDAIPDSWKDGESTLKALHIGQGVTTIGSSAFYGCSGFTGSLTIPDSVTSIGSEAFNYCSGFASLVVGNSVTSIGSEAFNYCTGITGDLTIPDSVTTIANDAFYYCTGFTGSLTISDSVTSIGSSAFSYCTGFTGSLTISDSVTSIGNYAFYGCLGFTGSLTIPDSVTSIGGSAFSYCSGLTNVNCYIPRTVMITNPTMFSGTGITTLHARASDDTWTAGADAIGGKALTVIKDL